MSLVESIANIVVGLAVSMGANAVVLPLLGFTVSLAQNIALTAIYTALSIARSYTMRRIFVRLHQT